MKVTLDGWLGLQAGEDVFQDRTLRCLLMEGVNDLSILSHYEVSTHDEWIVSFVKLWKRQTFHLPLGTSVAYFCFESCNPTQPKLSIHSPLGVTVGRKLIWICFPPDKPTFPVPICQQNDLASQLLEL